MAPVYNTRAGLVDPCPDHFPSCPQRKPAHSTLHWKAELERVAQRQLDQPGLPRRSDASEGRRCDVAGGIQEIRMVNKVESFRAERDLVPLRDLEGLGHGDVAVHQSRTVA